MTMMVASVTGLREAELALAAGADIIDVIRTRGLSDTAIIDPMVAIIDIAARVGTRCPVSAPTGVSIDDSARLAAVVGALARAGATYIRQEIGPSEDLAAALRVVTPFAGQTTLIAVLAATGPLDFPTLPAIAAAGFAGAMLDSEASGRRLIDQVDITVLRRFVESCHAWGLTSGFAGRLEAPDVPRLLQLQPGLLAFRDGLHKRGVHAAPFDPGAAAKIRALIPQAQQAGRPDIARAVDLTAPTDRVFLSDLILPIYVGAYGHEKQAPQRVRFNVEVHVSRLTRPSQDMRDVFSYDVILDAIRLLVDAGHFMFIETLGERIAARLLAQPRVVKVAVRLEKLDLGPYRVGVTIERDRESVLPHARDRLAADPA